jgi:hypothetical protein
MKTPTEKELYEFCKDHYYCDALERWGRRPIWEPFEGYSEEDIEVFIENDVCALKRFFGLV